VIADDRKRSPTRLLTGRMQGWVEIRREKKGVFGFRLEKRGGKKGG